MPDENQEDIAKRFESELSKLHAGELKIAGYIKTHLVVVYAAVAFVVGLVIGLVV